MPAKKKTEKVTDEVVKETKKPAVKAAKVSDAEPEVKAEKAEKVEKKQKAEAPVPLTVEEVAARQVAETKKQLEDFYIRTNQKGALAQLRASK